MNKLAKYIIGITSALCLGLAAWYFSSVLIYIIVAAVISIIGRPLMIFLSNLKIKNWHTPRWLAAIITISSIVTVIASLFIILTPLLGQIIKQLYELDLSAIVENLQGPISSINEFVVNTLPNAPESFDIESYILGEVGNIFDLSIISDIINSTATIIMDLLIGLFSIIFISFFFLINDGMPTNIVIAALPEKHKDSVIRASQSISHLLSRYFLGISLESLFISIINSLALIIILKVDTSLAIVLAFATGLLNIIPYVGPLIGHILAVIIGAVTFSDAATSLSFGVYLISIFSITMSTQLIDNYIFQPFIYSNSVKAHPLEIFIVILLAGNLGGVVGMLIAIPAYTVMRVIAREFFSKFKIVQELTENIRNE